MNRGVLPTYIADDNVVLSKKADRIRNSYEIRVTLFMAKQQGLRFVLAVPESTSVDEDLESHLLEHGGEIQRADLADYSVYLGTVGGDGNEGDGWVFGDNEKWSELQTALTSDWLRSVLQVGRCFSGGDLARIAGEIAGQPIDFANVDKEDIKVAIGNLVEEATASRGELYIQ